MVEDSVETGLRDELLANVRRLTRIVLDRLENGAREGTLDQGQVVAFRRQLPSGEIREFRGQVESCKRAGVEIIRWVDERYPPQLRGLIGTPGGPPLLLLKRGPLGTFDRCVAVAGTRDASFYGRTKTLEIAQALASKGFVIVSGLARGIDEWAHVGALKAKSGKTAAVLPWLDPVYPPEHAELLHDIEEKGASLSEHYVQRFWKTAKGKFVERNRITSGLSLCVLAMESDQEGGTVHQVDLALRQGKKVFALLPKKTLRAKRGFDLFLSKGATPMHSADEVLDYLKSQKRPVKETRMDAFYPNPQGKLDFGNTRSEDSF